MAQAAREEPSLQVNRLMGMRVKGFAGHLFLLTGHTTVKPESPPKPKKHLAFVQALSNQDAAIHSMDIRFATERHAQLQLSMDDLQRFGDASLTHGTQAK